MFTLQQTNDQEGQRRAFFAEIAHKDEEIARLMNLLDQSFDAVRAIRIDVTPRSCTARATWTHRCI
jgi:hypothetical protein